LLPTPAASCAAGYAWGEDGSNQCPTSYYAIVDMAACERAATAAGEDYIRSETDPSYPSGCYFSQGGNAGFYFNADTVGAGVRRTQLLCSGAALLARPAQAPRGVDACSSLSGAHGILSVLMGYYWGAQVCRIGAQRGARRATWLDAHGRTTGV
jgi:hypothetical protein